MKWRRGPVDDPVVERLDEALTDARTKLNQVILAGHIPEESLRMLIEVRQDLVFLARANEKDRHGLHERIDELEKSKVDKNPNTVWMYRTTISASIAAVIGLLVWLVQGGPG